jgi:hypothetical protein
VPATDLGPAAASRGAVPAGTRVASAADEVVAARVPGGDPRCRSSQRDAAALTAFPCGHGTACRERGAIVGSILGILVCGVAGGLAAWALVTALGFDGVLGAILAALVGMVVATALWAGGSSLLRALGWLR